MAGLRARADLEFPIEHNPGVSGEALVDVVLALTAARLEVSLAARVRLRVES